MVIEQPLLLAAVIGGATVLAFWLDRRYRWAETVGATLLVIIFGALLSNLGLVPVASPVYDALTGPVTSLAIVWLLFAVDLRDLKAAGPRMLAAFGIAVAATATGAVTATFVFAEAFGVDAWKMAGVMTGTYAGGSLNFVAVGRELELPAALFAAATAADNVVTALWIGATLLLPVWLGRYYSPVPAPPAVEMAPAERAYDGAVGVAADDGVDERTATPEAPGPVAGGEAEAGAAPGTGEDHPFFGTADLRLIDVTALLALGFFLLWAAERMAEWVPAVPSVLWLTTFALALGQLPVVRRLAGAMQLGTLALHFFFVVIGIGSRVAEIARVGPEVFYFTAMVVAIHGLLLYGIARLVRLDIGTTSVASQAAVGGPSTALALAVARDWRALVLPGIVAGLLGYAAGNYVAFGIAYIMRGVLGG